MISIKIENIYKGKQRKYFLIVISLLLFLSTCFTFIFYKPILFTNIINQSLLRINGFKSKYVQLQKYRMHYWVGGTGQSLVLVSGLGGKADDFSFMLPKLAEKYRVYAIDMIGFGESDKPNDVDYSIEFQSHQLLQFFEIQKISQANLMGFSMGGWISLKFASEWSQKVNKLILIASGGLKYKPAMNLDHFAAPQNLNELRESFNLMALPVPPEFIQRDYLRYYQKQRTIMKRAIHTMFDSQDFLDGKLGKVTMPVLLIWGKLDGAVPVDIGIKMHKEMPHSVFLNFGNCGHNVLFQCRDKVIPQLYKFLNDDSIPGSMLNFN